MEFVSRKTSGFWNRQYAISIEIRIAHLQKEFQAPVSEICSVLMRNIYVSWKSKHFVSDYGKKSSQKLNIFPAPASEFNWEIYVSFLSNSLTHTPRNMSWIGHFLVFPPICSLIPPTHTPFRELRKISSCITYSTQCAATNLVNNKLLIWTLIS